MKHDNTTEKVHNIRPCAKRTRPEPQPSKGNPGRVGRPCSYVLHAHSDRIVRSWLNGRLMKNIATERGVTRDEVEVLISSRISEQLKRNA